MSTVLWVQLAMSISCVVGSICVITRLAKVSPADGFWLETPCGLKPWGPTARQVACELSVDVRLSTIAVALTGIVPGAQLSSVLPLVLPALGLTEEIS